MYFIHNKKNILFSSLLFLISIIIIYFKYDISYLFYPLFYLPFIFLSEAQVEIRFVLVLIYTIISVVLANLLNDKSINYILFSIETLFLWIFSYLTFLIYFKKNKEKENFDIKLNTNLKKFNNLIPEEEKYKKYLEKFKEKINISSNFSQNLSKIQEKTSLEDIINETISSLYSSFKDSSIKLVTTLINDSVASYVYQTQVPLLIKNTTEELRFKKENFKTNENSLILAPINNFSTILAIIKISSSEKNRFSENDLRIVENFAKIASISIENLTLFKQINEMAMKDALTQLFTHKAFQDKLDMEILSSGRTKLPFSLVIADIDHFKKYNDNYGHQAGDEVLKKTANIFSSSIRQIDLVARYGGEEFAFILPGLRIKESFLFIQDIKNVLNELEFNFSNTKTKITASFGIAEFSLEASTKSQLIRLADERLYKAKQTGRNKIIYE